MAEKKQSKASSNGEATAHWLFQEREITVRPITLLSLLAVILAAFITGEYREKVHLCELSLTEEEKITWLELPRGKPTDDYVSLSNGASVFRRFHMDDFLHDFWVEPINWPEVDKDLLTLIKKSNLRESLLQNKNILSSTVKLAFDSTDKYAPKVKEIESAVKNGTYTDDRSMYVRWVDDNLRFGLFAGRDFEAGELLGVYTGEYTSSRSELEYAWEYNFLIQLKDEKGNPVGCYIDGKRKGNYMRFANHKDVDYNGDATYIIYDNMWYVIYIVKTEIKSHEQIFVNYGEAYWMDRTKY